MIQERRRTLNQYSPANIALVEAALANRPCKCHPESGSIKTYVGWTEIGRRVKRGEHAFVSVPTFIVVRDPDQDPDAPPQRTRPWTAHLFCECQTIVPKERE